MQKHSFTTQLDHVGVQELLYQGKNDYKTPGHFLRENSLNSFWRLRKKHISLSWWRRFHSFRLDPKNSACFSRQIPIKEKLIKLSCINKCSLDEEQVPSNVR
jgi:hypothetical protein